MFYRKATARLKDLLLKVAQPELSRIHKFKDIHKCEECYIFGDGVSLKWFNLKNFTNKLSISAGGLIPFHKLFDILDPKYLMITEPFWFYPEVWTKYVTRSTSMPAISKAYRGIIESNKGRQFLLNLSNFPVIRSPNVTYMFRDIVDERLPSRFITHRARSVGIDPFAGSLRAAIIMAIYMGFDRIYLVGCDYTHLPSRNLHWYEKGQGVFCPHENYQKDFFKIAKEFVDITTITLHGTSNFINAVTYKEYTGIDPIYRENTDLVDEKFLQILATWPGYSIY